MNLDEREALGQEAAKFIPALEKLHKKSLRLAMFNQLAFFIPAATLIAPQITDKISFRDSVIAGTFAVVAAIQASRIGKGQIRDTVDQMWDATPAPVREQTIGPLKHRLNELGKSTLVVSREDFGTHPHKLIPLGSAGICSVFLPQIAPLAFLAGTQAREYGDTAKLEIGTRYTLLNLRSSQRHFS